MILLKIFSVPLNCASFPSSIPIICRFLYLHSVQHFLHVLGRYSFKKIYSLTGVSIILSYF